MTEAEIIREAKTIKKDLNHCIRCNNQHSWNRRMLLAYGDKKRAVMAVLCEKCGAEYQKWGLTPKKIEDLHEIAFDVLRRK
jgi:transcription elongation factor Elf1